MIPTITNYLYQLHHEKPLMEIQFEKRRAKRFLSAITACLVIAVYLWMHN